MTTQSISIPPIPCCWPGCDRTFSRLNGLSQHVHGFHSVRLQDFGCSACGFIATNIEQVQRHQVEVHGRVSKPVKARQAFVTYCRDRLIQSQPALAIIPAQHFWQRGPRDRKAELRKRPRRTPRKTGGRVRATRSLNTTNYCPKCNEAITPWSSTNLLNHFAKAHSIFVNLDFENLSHHPRYEFKSHREKDLTIDDTLLGASLSDGCSDSGTESDLLDTDTLYDDEVSHGNASPEVQMSYFEQPSGDSNFCQPHHARRNEIREDEMKKAAFMYCVRNEKRVQVEQIFHAYEMRNVTGEIALINKSLPQDTKLDPYTVVYAVHISSSWLCKVVHCGVILPSRFSIELHLDAHERFGAWYCGELSCQSNLYEKPFSDRERLEKHLIQVHHNSDYSRAAARPFPKQDIFTKSLGDVLKLRLDDEPIVDLSSPEANLIRALRLAVIELSRDDKSSSSDSEIRAWQEYSQATHIDDYLDTENCVVFDTTQSNHDKATSAFEVLFAEHLHGSHVSLRKSIQGKESHSSCFSQVYWVKMLTCVAKMNKRDAMMYVLSYHKFCESASYKTVNNLLDNLQTLADSYIKEPTLASQQQSKASQSSFQCPWLDCDHTRDRAYDICRHFVDIHVNCIWQCPETGCEHCAYRNFSRYERHRIACHVGTPLQCGHRCCERAFLHHTSSRGHASWSMLQLHFEEILNEGLENPQLGAQDTPQNVELQQQLPLRTSYEEMFRGGSLDFLSPDRRQYSKDSNYRLLERKASCKQQARIEIQGQKRCTGFFLHGRHFECVDSVALELDTVMLLFIPSLMTFTAAPTCNYCIHVMSLISRCRTQIPNPFTFSPANLQQTRKRQGVGSQINDHQSFLKFVSENPLPLPPMALKFRDVQRNPQDMFIVDFETLLRTKKGLPLVPTEVTFRYGDGTEILSCIINEKGVTNTEFEEKMATMGFEDARSFSGARRIRGKAGNHPPQNSKSPREIVSIIVAAGLSPRSYWVEYSTNNFDLTCMMELIKMAGRDFAAILPPLSQCWTVLPDFSIALPGLRSYSLGRVAALMNPTNPDLDRLHFSREDTAVLYDVMHRWFHIHGIQL